MPVITVHSVSVGIQVMYKGDPHATCTKSVSWEESRPSPNRHKLIHHDGGVSGSLQITAEKCDEGRIGALLMSRARA